MSNDFIRRIKNEITRAEHASEDILAQIEEELEANPSAQLWILRGDAIQLSDVDDEDMDEAEASYRQALELDPNSAEAYESLGHFTLDMNDDPLAAAEYFRRAIALGAGKSAKEGLKEAEAELADQ
ncbi:MAG TPA: tetratricopeptide repeat protein [Thermoanaerobaculia bacterium]|jgi:cytochrome c-type biogenesis protein CcmH/NrfG